jgi:DNA-binding transcriptional ArsR family regulator
MVPASDRCAIPCFKGELVARLRKRMPEESRLEGARAIFAALADRQRLKILHALKDGEELCVCDVAHVLKVSISAASHHLRKMRDMGILRDRNDGKMMYYSLRSAAVSGLMVQALKNAT